MARAKLLEVQELQSECESELRTIEEGLRGPASRPQTPAEGTPLMRAGRQNSSSVSDALIHLRNRLIDYQDARLDAIEISPGEDESRQLRKRISASIAALVERVRTAESAVEMHAPLEIVEALQRAEKAEAPPKPPSPRMTPSSSATSIEEPLQRQTSHGVVAGLSNLPPPPPPPPPPLSRPKPRLPQGCDARAAAARAPHPRCQRGRGRP